VTKPHNPTPEERDERFSLYGLDPEKVGEALLETKPDEPVVRSQRRTQRKKLSPDP
jgi:hypothetical protein